MTEQSKPSLAAYQEVARLCGYASNIAVEWRALTHSNSCIDALATAFARHLEASGWKPPVSKAQQIVDDVADRFRVGEFRAMLVSEIPNLVANKLRAAGCINEEGNQ
jgi:hypothetical protein